MYLPLKPTPIRRAVMQLLFELRFAREKLR